VEWAGAPCVSVENKVSDLEPLKAYAVAVGGTVVDTCISNDAGEISFFRSIGCSPTTIEVLVDTLYAGMGEWTEDKDGIALLVRSYPNPTTGGPEIAYAHSGMGRVSVGVYSTSGLLIRTLVDRVEAPGRYSVSWDRRNMRGEPVAPGVYLCRLRTRSGTRSHKMVLTR
jgi:hypothetical protein